MLDTHCDEYRLASSRPDDPAQRPWTAAQLVLFRIYFLLVVQVILPVQPSRWKRFSLIRDLRDFVMWLNPLPSERFGYVTVAGDSGRYGIGSFASWGIAIGAAVLGGLIWTWLARNSSRREYHKLYYWTNLCNRYFLALNMLDFGYMKFFPEQMPFPTIANRHTLFGEIAAFRLYWHSVGLVTWYQVFLGFMELIGGVLMLFRQTTAIGAVVLCGMLFNIAHSNFAYDGGVQVHSATISLLAGFLFAEYVPDLWKLLIRREDVIPWHYHPHFDVPWKKVAFYGTRTAAWIFLLPVYGYVRYDLHYNTNMGKEPKAPGIPGTVGFYQVTRFIRNGEELPYSPLSPVRWQSASFEAASTFVYKVNRAMPVRLDNGADTFWDIEKRYEMAGFAGGRKYLFYDYDLSKQLLFLRDKNILTLHERQLYPGAAAAKGWKPAKVLTWHYTLPEKGHVTLSGMDEDGTTIEADLELIEEQQAIHIDSPVQGQPLHYDRTFYRRIPMSDKSFDGYGASPAQGPK